MATIEDYREKERYVRKANQVEAQYGIPNNLLVGLLKTESNLNPQAVSSAGAKGIAQFMPNTAKEYGINPYNPTQSIEAAGKYLANSYKKLGNWQDALRSYNMGLQGVLDVKAGKRKLPKETAEYTGKVYKNAKIQQGTSRYATPIADEAIRQVNDYFVYQPTTTVKDLQNIEETVNFAEETKDADIEEVKQQTKEYNFLEEYKALVNQQPQEAVVQEEVQPQIPQQNLEDIYNQVSEFVDTPTAQQGIALNTGASGVNLLNILPKNKVDVRKQGDLIRVPADWDINRAEEFIPTTNKIVDRQKRDLLASQAAIGFKDWYTNPITAERFAKNTGFDKNRLQDFVQRGLDTPTRPFKQGEEYDNSGSQMAAQYLTPSTINKLPKGQILYDPTGDPISGDKSGVVAAIGHEFPHASTIDTTLGKPLMRILGDPNKQQIKNTSNANKRYLSRPEESYGNFHQFRLELGLKPGEKVDVAKLKQLVNEKKAEGNMFYQTYDDDKIVKAINTIALNEEQNQDNISYAQQGGIPISSNGVYDYPAQNVIVPTTDGKITMRGVNYPILGIDEFGNQQMMYPNQEYKFTGKTITEIPQLADNEQKFLKYIKKIR